MGYTLKGRINDVAMPILLRRTSTGSGFTVGASGRDGVGGALKSVDLYAKMPRELAEGTYLGGVFSILLMFVFVSLFGMQLRALWTVGTRTDIAVDHSEDAKFQVNFKVELPALSCEWATVDVIDALGTRHFNISGESIYKHSMGASRYLGVEHASAGRESQREPEYGDTTDLDHYGNRRIAYEVTGATFERMIRAHKVLLVEFHAPWCSHCQRLAPIYEHAAELVRSELRRGKRAELARRTRHRRLHRRKQQGSVQGAARAGVSDPSSVSRRFASPRGSSQAGEEVDGIRRSREQGPRARGAAAAPV